MTAHRHPCLKWDLNPRSPCLSAATVRGRACQTRPQFPDRLNWGEPPVSTDLSCGTDSSAFCKKSAQEREDLSSSCPRGLFAALLPSNKAHQVLHYLHAQTLSSQQSEAWRYMIIEQTAISTVHLSSRFAPRLPLQ
jgi:hypothetical protein